MVAYFSIRGGLKMLQDNITWHNAGNDDLLVLEVPNGVELSATKQGVAILKLNGFYLQSSYDPIKEAKRIAEKEYCVGNLHVLFGLGLGYTAVELAGKLKDEERLIIIEPNIELFTYLNTNDYLDPLNDNEKVRILVGFDSRELESLFRQLIIGEFFGRVRIIEGANYSKIYPNELKSLYEAVRNASKYTITNINTINFFSKKWQENFIYNFRDAWKTVPLSRFKNKLTCPVVIASSGPSLSKQLELLKEIRDRVLIICAGSTINPLLKSGITPHLIVTVDGGDNNYEHFSKAAFGAIPMAYSFNVHKGIPRIHQGYKIVFNGNVHAMSDWVDEVYGEELGIVQGGASVANYCFDIALQLSSGPICFIGQDLAYTNNQTHAEGNANVKTLKHIEIAPGSRYTKTEGYYGELILTDFPFLSMKRSFEDRIVQLKNNEDNRRVINSTEGGVNILGADNVSFQQFINEYCGQDYSSELKLFEASEEINYTLRKRIDERLVIEQEILTKVRKLSRQALDILSGISADSTLIDAKVLKKIDRIDIKLKELMDNNLLHFVVLPTLVDITYFFAEKPDETQIECTQRVLSKSKVLYQAILQAANYTNDILIEVLQGEEVSNG